MAALSVAQLQALEEAAWATPHLRALYSTRYVPGFPYHTVIDSDKAVASPSLPSSDSFHGSTYQRTVRRHVVPYDFPFTVFVKGRWVGRRLLDVYAEELPHHTPAYYEACLLSGRLYCVQRATLGRHNTQRRLLKRGAAPPATSAEAVGTAAEKVLDSAKFIEVKDLDAHTTPSSAASESPQSSQADRDALNVVLQHGDVVYHTVHRHEVPVTVGLSGVDAVRITAVRIRRYGLVCVNKPTGLPTHATGRYMYNSLTALLEYVMAPKRLRAWVVQEDPLLQALVSTTGLSAAEKQELYEYYAPSESLTEDETARETMGQRESSGEEGSEVDPDKLPRPCHRLDKVTSGVLLLAVSQDAAKRIGVMLMQKSKEVEAAVTAELLTTAEDRGNEKSVNEAVDKSAEDGKGFAASPAVSRPAASSPPEPILRVVGREYDLQKFYLARVTGLPQAPSPLVSSAWLFTGREACLQQHNAAVKTLLSSAPDVCTVDFARHTLDTEHNQVDCAFPGGVLTAAPVAAAATHNASTAVHVDEEDTTHKAPTTTKGQEKTKEKPTSMAKRDSPANVSAATLCQTLSTASRTVNGNMIVAESTFDGDATVADMQSDTPSLEAVVLCTPYTGRLHQIRVHLSALGCPIVGDVVYTSDAKAGPSPSHDNANALQEVPPTTSSTVKAESENEAARWVKNERDYHYFDVEQLPQSYRNFCGNHDLFLHECATVGTKRDRADASVTVSAAALAKSSVSASAWVEEPLCYECAGRLPIVATKECATGTAAICLHAWAYEVKESLLVDSQTQSETARVPDDETSETGRSVSSVELQTPMTAAGVRAPAGGVCEVQDGFVRFEAPPPAWARMAS